MYPCKKCLENNWKYKKIDNEVFATCQICGNETSWIVKSPIPIKKKYKISRYAQKYF